MSRILRKLFANSFYLFCMNLSTLGALFVFSVLLARTMGKEVLGLYALFTAFLMPFSFFVDFGQSTSIVQESGKSPHLSAEIVKHSIVLKFLLGTIAAVLILVLSAFYFDQAGTRKLFLLFAIILIPRALHATVEAGLRARQMMAAPMWAAIISSVLLVAGSWLLLRVGVPFQTILIFLVLVECVKLIVLWKFYVRAIRPGLELIGGSVDWRLVRRLAYVSLTFFAVGIAGILHDRIDVMLLAALKNAEEVGTFSAAHNFVKVLRIAPSVIVASFFPAISGMTRDDPNLKPLARKTLWVQFGFSAALAAIIFAAAELLIMATYRFDEAVAVLRISVWSLVPLALYSTLVYVFFKEEKARWNLLVLSSAVVVNVISNLLLIPSLGAQALAWSNLVSESYCFVILFALYLYLMRGDGFNAHNGKRKSEPELVNSKASAHVF